jgi:cobalt-zinc-cadmium efflux system protein
MLAGVIILRTRWYQADALASAGICLFIVLTSYWLLRDSIHILLEGAPAHLDIDEIRGALEGLDGVKEVHDLHLWSLTQGSESMSGHLVISEGLDSHEILERGQKLLKDRFRLEHVTLQIEK